MTRDRSELAVGATVIAALGILLYSTFRIGGCSWLEPPGRRLIARFDYAAGVEPRTDLLIAGVKVGEVERVSLEEGRARLTMRLDDPSAQVPVDSSVAIRSRGLLGERVVEIVPGRDDRMAADGDTLIRTVEAPNLDAMLDHLASVAKDIREVSRSVRLVLGGAEGEETLAGVVEDVRFVAARLRSFIEDNDDELARILSNFDEASGHLSSFSADLARITHDNEQTVGEMLRHFAATSRRLEVAVADLATVSARVERGEGTLGRLLSDDELYTKVDESVTELQRTLVEVRHAAEEAQEQLPVTVLGSLVGSLF